MGKKAVLAIFKFVTNPSRYFKKGISKKIVPGIFRFVSMLFYIFENCVRYL